MLYSYSPPLTFTYHLYVCIQLRSVPQWKDALQHLETEEGLAWRLIFYLLAAGRLYDEGSKEPLRISPRSILKQFKGLFVDI